MSQETKGVFAFGPFRLDADQGLLTRGGEPVAITPKVLETLFLLVKKAPRVVPRDEMMEALWQDRTVADANLTQNVWFLRKALREEEDGVRYVETLPRRGYRFVAPVTRVWEAEAEAEAAPAAPPRAPTSARRARLRAAVGAALLLVVLGLGVGLGRRLFLRTAPGGAGAQKARPSAAILELRNLSGRGDAAWLATALSEMLATELAAGGRLRVLPGESVARTRAELKLAPGEADSGAALARVRARLGADLFVLGAYTLVGTDGGGKLRVDLRVVDAARNEAVGAFSESGTEGELFDLVARAGARLRAALGVPALSSGEASGLKGSVPSNPEAARLYADGLEALRSFDARGAREKLERAAALDPEAPLVHSALSAAWSALGYDQRSRAEAERAFGLSTSLPREDRLRVEGRFREATRDWDRASDVYRALFGFFPDNLEYGLRLADVETSGGKGRQALRTVGSLRRLRAPDREDPRIDLQEARTAEALADFGRAKAAAERAAAKGLVRAATHLVAQARLLESTALGSLGDLAAARRAGEEARRLFQEAGDRRGVAQATDGLASVLTDVGEFPQARRLCEEAAGLFRDIGSRGDLAAAENHLGFILLFHEGNLAGARDRFQEALALYRETGNQRKAAGALNNLAIVKKREGDLEGARALYAEALAVYTEIADPDGVSRVRNNLAIVLLSQGKLAEAKGIYEESLRAAREVGDKNHVASTLSNVALLALELGEPARAHRMAEEAVTLAKGIGNRQLHSFGLSVLGDTLTQEGDLAAARKTYEEALAIQKEVGQKGEIANTRAAIASLLLEEERPADAEREARACAEIFRELEQPDEEAHALLVLADALVTRGEAAAASSAFDRVKKPLAATQSAKLRLDVGFSRARLLGARGATGEARARLEETVRECERMGEVLVRLQARLELGKLQKGSEGRALLLAVEKEAGEKGYGLLARRARAATVRLATSGARPT